MKAIFLYGCRMSSKIEKVNIRNVNPNLEKKTKGKGKWNGGLIGMEVKF